MTRLNLIQSMHNKTHRDYIQRVVEHDKAHCAEIAKNLAKNTGMVHDIMAMEGTNTTVGGYHSLKCSSINSNYRMEMPY